MFALGLIGYAYGAEVEIDQIEVSRINLKLPRLDPAFKGIKLVQISDAHLGFWMNKERLDRILDLAVAEKPDYFILTGDFIEKHPQDMSREESIAVISGTFSKLAAYRPTIAVLGNHDHRVNAWMIQQSLAEAGVLVLRNSITTIKRGASKMHIAGVDDVREGMARLDQVLRELPADGASILLVHEPDFADTSAATGRFDLQLSGHSHGGQIVLPLLGPVYLPDFGQKYPSGLYDVSGMLLYTNRGIGVTGIRARFNCRPEITVFTLEPGQAVD
jgi:predicted MPP superfamily phosphohydrolase